MDQKLKRTRKSRMSSATLLHNVCGRVQIGDQTGERGADLLEKVSG